ncbi:glycosyltransferase family 2 protein [Algoriphagus limi]|uniref:Glycosyltransferase family 2 protein n=1 Tax=Algoriphagus limi TaxID=2975273 RepID=A0ABT2G189_9BACT|nr:glycosyltransferase family A protein [Algoriphagus limi]MCS5489026.1 glycosyltransferase family 2 protein [Algoriphagus limi]
MDPKISIIIPFFNSEFTLKRAVDSVISQDFSDWELILVNDGSTDDSQGIVQEYLMDKRVTYLFQENKGVCAARNKGAFNSKAQWLVFLDSDDMLLPGTLYNMGEEIQQNPSYQYFHFGVSYTKGQVREDWFPSHSSNLSKLAGSFLLKKSVFSRVGGYDEKLKFSENTELFHRIELLNVKYKMIPRVSVNYFKSESGGSKNTKNILDGLEYILEKHSKTLTNHVKFLYHQSAGVIYIRFRDFPSAKYHLIKALKFKPWEIGTWARLSLTFIPPIAKKIYKTEVSFD